MEIIPEPDEDGYSDTAVPIDSNESIFVDCANLLVVLPDDSYYEIQYTFDLSPEDQIEIDRVLKPDGHAVRVEAQVIPGRLEVIIPENHRKCNLCRNVLPNSHYYERGTRCKRCDNEKRKYQKWLKRNFTEKKV